LLGNSWSAGLTLSASVIICAWVLNEIVEQKSKQKKDFNIKYIPWVI
jgi:hypothetical protein